jgi:2-C-methyl-D-erythritol 4-phosphate cytidylyltransferase
VISRAAYIHDSRRWSFLIPAAGPGVRLGRGPKCLLLLGGEPLWARAVRRARRIAGQVVLAVPGSCLPEVRGANPPCDVIEGGASRQDTVARLLSASSGDRIFIHDVVRPFGSTRLMLEVAALAEAAGAAACLSALDSPVVRVRDGLMADWIPPADVGHAQSPLAFHRSVLEDADREAGRVGFAAGSTVELVWRAGHPVRFAEAERENIKITYPGDDRLASMVAAAWDDQDNTPG